MTYIPNTTSSSQEWSIARGPGLRVELGQERFEALASEYIQVQGFSEEEAQEIVAATEENERHRPIKWARQVLRTAFWPQHVEEDDAKYEAKMDAKERQQWEEIYEKESEENRKKLVEERVDDARASREDARERNRQHNRTLTLLTEVIFRDIPHTLWSRAPLFTAEGFAQVLQRLQEHHLAVEVMGHFSDDVSLFRRQDTPENPLALLALWCSEGCKEQFWGIFRRDS
jgi:hypothetical protein